MPNNNELDDFARSLRYAANAAPEEIRDVVRDSARNISNRWKQDMRGISNYDHIPYLPKAVGYNTVSDPRGASARIGIDYSKPQGPLGHFIEFGSVNNPPHFLGEFAMLAEEPNFVKKLEDIVEKL